MEEKNLTFDQPSIPNPFPDLNDEKNENAHTFNHIHVVSSSVPLSVTVATATTSLRLNTKRENTTLVLCGDPMVSANNETRSTGVLRILICKTMYGNKKSYFGLRVVWSEGCLVSNKMQFRPHRTFLEKKRNSEGSARVGTDNHVRVHAQYFSMTNIVVLSLLFQILIIFVYKRTNTQTNTQTKKNLWHPLDTVSTQQHEDAVLGSCRSSCP